MTEDLGTKRAEAEFVPRLLLQEQKEFRAAVARVLLPTCNNDLNFLTTVIPGDESGVYGSGPEIKA